MTKVANYKLDSLYTAIHSVIEDRGLGVKNAINLGGLYLRLQEALKPYYENRNNIMKKYKDDAEVKAKQDEIYKELEPFAKEEVGFDIETGFYLEDGNVPLKIVINLVSVFGENVR